MLPAVMNTRPEQSINDKLSLESLAVNIRQMLKNVKAAFANDRRSGVLFTTDEQRSDVRHPRWLSFSMLLIKQQRSARPNREA